MKFRPIWHWSPWYFRLIIDRDVMPLLDEIVIIRLTFDTVAGNCDIHGNKYNLLQFTIYSLQFTKNLQLSMIKMSAICL